MSIHYQISLLRDAENLQEKWMTLEKRAVPNFMLSWSWIGSWIKTAENFFSDEFSQNFFLLEGFVGDDLIALAIIVKHRDRRYGFISSQQLLLHKSGFSELDITCQEYNGILAVEGQQEAASAAAMDFLIQSDEARQIIGAWDEFILNSAEPISANAFMRSDFSREMKSKTNSYIVDLAKIRASNVNYLESLSKNTRYQIKRSIRLYEERGGMQINFAKNATEAYDFFKEGGDLFKQRWGKDDEKSAFDMLPFMGFQQEIIRAGFAKGEINVIRLSIGQGRDEVYMGMLYNFIHQGQVYFYMNALLYENNSKLKPGIVAHSLTIQHYLERGFDIYNFMGGDSRYKENLGDIADLMLSYSYKRQRVVFKVENILKKIKNIVKLF